jgi:hypothetical protein
LPDEVDKGWRGLDERVLGLAENESVRTGGGVDGAEFDLLSK